MDRVFRRHKISEVDTVKSQRKFLTDKDTFQRIKHLKLLISQLPLPDLQTFFVENRSYVFHTFSDAFFTVEQELKFKSNPTNVKDLENVLFIFENILILLPEFIQQRWQYNCIVEVLEELLNEKNNLYIRKYGIKLFLLWYQILGPNATSKGHQMFNNLVPGFGHWIYEYQKRSTAKVPARGSVVSEHSKNKDIGSGPIKYFGVSPKESGVLLPSFQFEQQQSNHDLGQHLLQHFLGCLVADVSQVVWSNGSLERHMLQFWFLFEQLKRTYLPVIFPCLSPLYSIYEPSQLKELKSPSEILSSLQDYPISPTLLPIYQETLVLWLTRYIDTNPKNYFPDPSSSIDERGTPQSISTISHHMGLATGTGSVDIHSNEKDYTGANPPHSPVGDPLLVNPDFFSATPSSSASSRREADRGETRDLGRHKSSVASSTMNSVSSFDQPVIRRPSSPGHHPHLLESKTLSRVNEANMVCAVLYQCRQNINLLHDILHHAFLLPIQCYNALFAVISVYSSWLEVSS
ncbi:hypothetical protein PHET_09304 [Paragonimus heterotremus]|uniref:Uncharacterized protein n=1 Tax=Paragonimus heterotremus TaxID=100268 RepID=A0A8J4TB10_9TREM|nr:hypothetical protein PHET_09304 [Paragonimus heterotremus]